jgi:hypothetical protein
LTATDDTVEPEYNGFLAIGTIRPATPHVVREEPEKSQKHVRAAPVAQ